MIKDRKKNAIVKYLLIFFMFMLFNSCKEETMVVTSDAKSQFFTLDFYVRDVVFKDKPTETYMRAYLSAPDTPVMLQGERYWCKKNKQIK